MRVRIGIVTRNRASILPKAIESALRQDHADKEVVVFDDASTDGTPFLRRRFPAVRFVRVERSVGYREARNRLMAEPGADLFCSLDDDSWFLDDDALSRAVPLFARDPRLGAVGFEILDAGKPESESPGRVRGRLVDTFIGCGHLLRLGAVRELGFYEDLPAAYGTEEKDLSLRLLDAGYGVVELVGLPVWHDKTLTTRNIPDQHVSGVLNDLSFAALRAPIPEVLGVIPGKMMAHLVFALSYALRRSSEATPFDRAIRGQHGALAFVRPTLEGILRFLAVLPGLEAARLPVARRAYHRYRTRSRGRRAPYAVRPADGVTISITTHDRCGDLEATLGELARLDPPPDEILVCLDGCSDGSAAMLARRHPGARVLANERRLGSIPSRDRIFREARHDLVLLLDDDSFPIEPDFVRRVRDVMDANPAIGIITFPQRSDEDPASLGRTDFGPARTTHSFQDSGSVVRRELYEALGGYPAFFEHAYEEPDLSIRCFEFGVPPVFWPGGTVRHRYTKVGRDELRTHHLHARNETLSILMRAPSVLVAPLVAWRTSNQGAYAARRSPGWLLREPSWWLRAFGSAGDALRRRRPVGPYAYLEWLAAGRERAGHRADPAPLVAEAPARPSSTSPPPAARRRSATDPNAART